MNLQFVAVLIVGAVASFAFMLKKIRKSEISIADSTFWFLFSLSLVLLAVFPGIAFFFADLLGVQAPSNFVFLYVIAVVVIRQFIMTAENARLRSRLTTLVQEQALSEAEVRDVPLNGRPACAAGDGASCVDAAEIVH